MKSLHQYINNPNFHCLCVGEECLIIPTNRTTDGFDSIIFNMALRSLTLSRNVREAQRIVANSVLQVQNLSKVIQPTSIIWND